jgi:3-oxoacyl-[acyl-carrier-protein] synthase II
MLPHRVVITGIGAISAIGCGAEQLWHGCLRSKSGIRRITRFDPTSFRSQIAAEVNGFDIHDYRDGKRVARLDRFSQFAVACAQQALCDAGFCPDALRGREIAVYLGSALGGVAFAEEQHERYLVAGLKAVAPSLALTVFAGAGATNIAIEFGFCGPAISNANSCASGAIAVGEAFRLLRSGQANIALAGGVEAPLAPLTFGSFALIKAMSTRNDAPALACRPFDRDRDGFVMGEGAAILVLEELQHAMRRDARIYAEILGYGTTNDAHHMTVPLADGREAARAVRLALAEARLEPSDVGYVNAHATGTPLGDAAESAALTAVFGEQTPPVSGTKALYGHALGASPALEAAITALAVHHNYAPATLNLCNVAPDCQLNHVCAPGQPLESGVALTTAFGFGGINAALLMARMNAISNAVVER